MMTGPHPQAIKSEYSGKEPKHLYILKAPQASLLCNQVRLWPFLFY